MNKNLKKENKNTTFGQGLYFFTCLSPPRVGGREIIRVFKESVGILISLKNLNNLSSFHF